MQGFNWINWILNNAMAFVFCVAAYSLLRWGRFKKAKVNKDGIEIENHTDADKFTVINPGAKCPYDEAYSATRNEIRSVNAQMHQEIGRINGLLQELVTKIDIIISESDLVRVEIEEVEINQLIMIFRSAEWPVEDRLFAGLRYVSKKRNGEIRREVIDMSKEHFAMYRGICASQPDYKIDEVEQGRGKIKPNARQEIDAKEGTDTRH